MVSQKHEGFRKAGTFTLATGTEVQGELCLKGAATTLDLYSSEFSDAHACPDIFGQLHDRSKVSLINCITLSRSTSGAPGSEYHQRSRVFPHFVIFGDQHINSSNRTIRRASFTVDDATMLFHDVDAFGEVINARPHMERIVEAKKERMKIEIGEYPQLFYYTGRHEILAVDTVLGRISVRHGISYAFPGPEGIHVDNTIRLNLTFDSDRTLDEVVTGVLDILRFLEVIAGRRQNISELTLFPVSDEEFPRSLEVYWCMPPHRDCDDGSHRPHPFDLPIQAATNPNEFASVLKRWLERNDAWRDARVRFSTALAYHNRYEIDRIVGAANMFDILPPSVYPETVSVPHDLEQARDNARKAFRALPDTPERSGVLGVLGRIGKPTLKRKVRSRAKLITDIIGSQFPELDVVVDRAVDCRNYYVHGSETRIDYSKHSDQVPFFTDTLEFIFAASDLVEAGWNIAAWARQGSTLSHPFGKYRVNYALRLGALKKLL